MKKTIDWLIPNALIMILFVGLAIEAKEIFDLGNQQGKHIDHIHLSWVTPLTLILFITSIYAMIKGKSQILLWTALITFSCVSILSILIYIDGHGSQAIVLPIMSIGLVMITILKIRNEYKAANKT